MSYQTLGGGGYVKYWFYTSTSDKFTTKLDTLAYQGAHTNSSLSPTLMFSRTNPRNVIFIYPRTARDKAKSPDFDI